jgi:hypothetical protein
MTYPSPGAMISHVNKLALGRAAADDEGRHRG